MILSLFCGAGGLDLGFERAGFRSDLALDKNPDSVASHNHNRLGRASAHTKNIRNVDLQTLDQLAGKLIQPVGVIGGPPCQSFSRANSQPIKGDPRHTLPYTYAKLIANLNARASIQFFAFENVPALAGKTHEFRFKRLLQRLEAAGFSVSHAILNAKHFSVPQSRERLFIVGFNSKLFGDYKWQPPRGTTANSDAIKTVAMAIRDLPEPVIFKRGLKSSDFALHPNHWCMAPKSSKFSKEGALKAGDARHRSFKTLSWDEPSLTVAYGHREVHIHPNCARRLSVFEAMRLQGFPDEYVLLGSLSSQINQVSEAVPPPLAQAVAISIREQLAKLTKGQTTSHGHAA